MSNFDQQSPEETKTGCLGFVIVLCLIVLISRTCSDDTKKKPIEFPQQSSSSQTYTSQGTSVSKQTDTLQISSPKASTTSRQHTAYSAINASCDEGYTDGYENGYEAGQRGLSYDYGYYYGDGSNSDPEAVTKYRECYDEGFQDGYYDGQAEYSAEQERIREEEERQRELYWFPW